MPWMPRKIANSRLPPIDLTLAFKGVEIKDPKYGELVRALRNIEATRSMHSDLIEAKSAIDTAAETANEPQKAAVQGSGPIVTEALFVHALMLYARAVHSSSKARFRIDLLGKMTADERDKHKYIVSIRDTVIAHYGSGSDLIPGPWVKDHVVLQRKPPNFEFTFPQMRIAHTGEAFAKLVEMIDRCIEIVIEIGIAKQNNLAEIVSKLLIDKEFTKLIEKYEFSERDFFGKAMPPGTTERYVVPRGERPSD